MSAFTSITLQSVLFHTPVPVLERTLASIDRVSQLGQSAGEHGLVDVAYGDCSPSPTLTPAVIAELNARHPGIRTITAVHFGENLGHGGAQNLLAESTGTDVLVTANPDVLPSRRALGLLVEALEERTVGIAEAKQLPLEHPKDYDRETGATSWASGAFSMFRAAEFRDIGGFDSASFFLYGDDVDLSWRYRLRGLRVIHQPAAAVFHDKRLGPDGEWLASDVEQYYSAESALLLAYKWSRDQLLDELLTSMTAFPDAIVQRAVTGFLRRRTVGDLPERLDPQGRTAEFVAGNYALHRW
ncbi:hypothetical protein ACEXQE_16070 [Herbiconiux sp. P17]|uniref:hypothetical protein n=1 Tax=Herbiconiux wuyangfengii TaxID=3342794 RepID=UPI0035B76A58